MGVKKKRPRYLLSLDVGIKGCGACLYNLNSDKLEMLGGIATKKQKKLVVRFDDFRRLRIVLDFLRPFRDKRPVGIIFECPGGSQNAVGAKLLGMAKTAAYMIGYEDKIPYRFFTPGQCKKAVTGDSGAEKEDVQKGVMARWPMARWPLGEKHFEDTCDAASVIVAAEQDGFLDFLKNGKSDTG